MTREMKVIAIFATMTYLAALAEVTPKPSRMDEKIASREQLSLTEIFLVDMLGTQRDILQKLRGIADNVKNITRTTFERPFDRDDAEKLEMRLEKERNNTKILTDLVLRLQERVGYLEKQIENTSILSPEGLHFPGQLPLTKIKCKNHYEIIGKDCLRFKLSDTKTWQDARKDCQNEGGDLAINFNLDLISSRLRGETVFILHVGASNLYANGNWWWLRTGAAVEPYYFAPGKPASASAEPENVSCGALSRQFNFRMVDRSCQSKLPYICQILPEDIWMRAGDYSI